MWVFFSSSLFPSSRSHLLPVNALEHLQCFSVSRQQGVAHTVVLFKHKDEYKREDSPAIS